MSKAPNFFNRFPRDFFQSLEAKKSSNELRAKMINENWFGNRPKALKLNTLSTIQKDLKQIT